MVTATSAAEAGNAPVPLPPWQHINSSGSPLLPLYSLEDLLGGSDAKKPLQTFRSYNVAHRGSSGEIPEETATSYLKAIEQGADFIETDILASQDGHLICFHDVTLDATTDIANNTEFAGRKRIYEVEGANITGWFVASMETVPCH